MRSAVLKGKKFCFSSWIKRNYGQVILNVVLMVLLLLCLFPFYIMVIDSFKTRATCSDRRRRMARTVSSLSLRIEWSW